MPHPSSNNSNNLQAVGACKWKAVEVPRWVLSRVFPVFHGSKAVLQSKYFETPLGPYLPILNW